MCAFSACRGTLIAIIQVSMLRTRPFAGPSFGTHNPGAVRLHNYPKFLQNRRLLHKPPVESFEVLTDNPTWAAELKRV